MKAPEAIFGEWLGALMDAVSRDYQEEHVFDTRRRLEILLVMMRHKLASGPLVLMRHELKSRS